jgi:undecaprenyl diphosphate synthase
MDGNGRWAKKRGMPRMMGHKQGADVLKRTLEDARDLGIKYLTVYAFSSENWSRPEEEISGIMGLVRYYLQNELKTVQEKGICIRFIGEHSRFPKDVQSLIHEAHKKTSHNTKFHLTISFGYGSRDEITRAVQNLAVLVEKGKLDPLEITQEIINQSLDTKEIPDPDLLIRTSGEQRLSNFLLWQMAYTEFVFLNVLWPDFSKDDLINACKIYNERNRTFGAAP